ncbi:MAG TPA: PhoU domain-containing protein, partial [Terriglobales bacterium]|nr:PhoU domain-containing protein [Terriglobales bacterium]
SIKKRKLAGVESHDELTRLALKSCLIARDSTFNMLELLKSSSRLAFLAIRDCEKELDQIERYIDEHLPFAITQVNEARARQLLFSLKAITNLERIGDLVMGVAQRLQSRSEGLNKADGDTLARMVVVVHDMLEYVHEGFLTLNLECARKVMRADAEVDRLCHGLFETHLRAGSRRHRSSFDVLLMAQAFERAGDHVTNLAEDLISLIEGHTARHPPKRKPT